MHLRTSISITTLLASLAFPALAQDQQPATEESAAAEQPAEASEDLLTAAQLEDLLAPVALFPDTLLVQILVAATYPLQIVKADQAVDRVADLAEEDRKAAIEAEGFDSSVEVLAVAFPDVLQRMSDNIDWTETVGDAMLAQNDDVLSAVQVLRQQAIETGALVDTPEQEVSVETTVSSMGEPVETVVVQPTNPETVYVPQYDPVVVYDTNRYGVGDALLTGAMVFGTVALIDEIFDDDDDWYGYWGCHNCGGWNGGPIIRDPDIDIDVDGNVNIGNEINIDRDNLNIDRDNVNIDRDNINIDRDNIKNEFGGWQPDEGRRDEARDKLAARGEGGGNRPMPQPLDNRGDDLRRQLSERTGTADISRPGSDGALRDAAVAAGAAGGAVAGREALKRAGDRGDVALKRPSKPQAATKRPEIKKPAGDKVARPAAATRPAASKPAIQKPAAKPNIKKPAAKPAVKKPASKPQAKRAASGVSKPAIKKSSGGARAKAASKRGGSHKKARR